jgi:hypothetical protein
MELWRVNVQDGKFQRYAGFGIVWAESAKEAGEVVVAYLKHDTAYAEPYTVSSVVPHEAAARPHVLIFNWGDWPEYPPPYDTPAPD